MAKIRWNGYGRRLALGYVWPGPGAVVEVADPVAAARLLAQPDGQFTEVEETPAEAEREKVIRKLSLKQAKEE